MVRAWPALLVCVLGCATCVCGCAGLVCVFLCWMSACFCLNCCLLLLYVSSSRLYHTFPQALKLSTFSSHGTTTVAHHVLPFVTDTDGASVFASCVCVLCFLWDRTHNLKRGGRTLRQGQDDTNPYILPRDLASNHAATVKQPRSHGYNNSSTRAPAL